KRSNSAERSAGPKAVVSRAFWTRTGAPAGRGKGAAPEDIRRHRPVRPPPSGRATRPVDAGPQPVGKNPRPLPKSDRPVAPPSAPGRPARRRDALGPRGSPCYAVADRRPRRRGPGRADKGGHGDALAGVVAGGGVGGGGPRDRVRRQGGALPRRRRGDPGP